MSDFRHLATPNVVRHPAASSVLTSAPQSSTPLVYRFRLSELPVSANDLVRPAVIGQRKGRPFVRLVKTEEAERWLARCRLELAAQSVTQPIAGPVSIDVTFVVSRITADTSNRLKALEDALTGYAWFDDCQVVELTAQKRLVGPKEKPWCEVRVAVCRCDDTLAHRIRSSLKGGGAHV